MRKTITKILLISLVIHFVISYLRGEDEPLYIKIIRNKGFQFEEHSVVTKDGFILTLWRIPRKSGESNRKQNIPIILQHGWLDDSWTWFTLKNNRSLPYLLVNNGYDVWLPNSRGSLFSSKHIDKNISSSKYWDFTFSEMAEYDLPAVINYIKEITNYDKVNYVAHSQGTTMFFLNYISDPSFWTNSIHSFIGLGPVASVKHSNSALLESITNTPILSVFKNIYPFGNFLLTGFESGKIYKFLCHNWTFVCKYIIKGIISIEDTDQIAYESDELANWYWYEPGGTSHKNILHWLQISQTKKMEKFDYGKQGNLQRYGQEYPPEYDSSMLNEWKIKTLLTKSKQDPFSSADDVQELIEKMRNGNNLVDVLELENYNHWDYLWSENAKEDIYDKVITFLLNNNRSNELDK